MTKKTVKTSAVKKVRFEEALWDTATRLRGSVESSEYKHVVLSLIFLKFVSDNYFSRLGLDGSKIGSMISRTQKELTDADIGLIAQTYHNWRLTPSNDECSMISDEFKTQHSELSTQNSTSYSDVPGFCKSSTIEEVAKHDYVLTPGRYVGAADIEDDGIPFETKMKEFFNTLYGQMRESAELDAVIRKNLATLGFGEE